MNLTYQELFEKLQGFTPTQLAQTATVWVSDYDEFNAIRYIGEETEGDDVLDEGHKFLVI